MKKRFQVFISSTYEDLVAERQAVMRAVLELDCMPAGMELFPAANEDPWTLITQIIQDCDYYIVVLGDRYGSVDADGISFTEREYRFAQQNDKPIIGFLCKEPGLLAPERREADPVSREKLDAFREVVKLKSVKFWGSPDELQSHVTTSLQRLIERAPAVGWVRADQGYGKDLVAENERLRKKVEELEDRLRLEYMHPPQQAQELQQGNDKLQIRFLLEHSLFGPPRYSVFHTTWNEVFAVVSPMMIDKASEGDLKKGLALYARDAMRTGPGSSDELLEYEATKVTVDENDFQTIKVHLRALGLIGASDGPRKDRHSETYWTLTPYGDTVMTSLRAVKKSVLTGPRTPQ